MAGTYFNHGYCSPGNPKGSQCSQRCAAAQHCTLLAFNERQ
jgi:hypothetical protein